jgi:hypothetical protein
MAVKISSGNDELSLTSTVYKTVAVWCGISRAQMVAVHGFAMRCV